MESHLPLSAAQLGVWYALKSGTPAEDYNIGEYSRISGAIDSALFERALHHVIGETETLRGRFVEQDGLPRQLIAASLDWRMTYRDVRADAEPVAAAEAWMRADMVRPVELLRGPLFTFALFRTGREEFLWYVRYHHLIIDAYGAWLVARRVAEVYTALAAGSTVAIRPAGSLAALVEEDAAYRASAHFTSDRQFWQQAMAECPEPPSLGIRAPSAATRSLRLTAELPAATVARLQDVARQTDLSLPQIVTLAAAVFIHRLTGTEDVVLGQMMSARMSQLSRQTPAMVTNVVPLRLAIEPDMRIEELAAQVRRKSREGMRRQRYRIADLRRDLRRIDKPVIGQIISVRPFDYDLRFAGLPITTQPISNGPVDDLNLYVDLDQAERGQSRIVFVANPTRYDEAALTRLQHRFLRLLAAMDDAAEPVGRLDILPPDERRDILRAWNETRAAYPSERQVHELFEDQARRAPDRIAVACGPQRLTYRELDAEAELVAAHLSALGVGPNDLVGLHVERSPGMLVGLLGILKVGGAYVPLDPTYPRDRLAFILEDARPLVLLTQRSLRDRLASPSIDSLCIDALPGQPADVGQARPAGRRQRGDLAYVLYTSGSTGQPKGVQIPHRALTNFLTAMQGRPGISAQDTLLAVTSLSFDIAGLELFLPLIAGAQVTIAPGDVAADGVRLATLMRACGATVMQATPATWRLLLEAGWQGDRTLKILCGGEAWPAELAGALLPRCGSLWNMYGPTETTIWSAVARIGTDQQVLIGPPIANTTFYVLDRYGEPVPVGVPGELCIGGDGVALGYVNRPELSREKFIADPFGERPAASMYKTGDLVRRLPDGRLAFLGRLDHQVKIRGYRIELGEIEAVLRRHPDVEDAVVVARDDAAGERRLVAYVTPRGAGHASPGSLRDLLRQKLAVYMIPAAFVPLETFPLTANGKIDRKALPAPDGQARLDPGELHVAPRTPLEEQLAGFWRECLGLDRIGIHDNFFDLGGDSLAMLRLSLQIEAAIGRSFPLTWVYDAPTIAGMAERLSGETAGAGYSPLVLLRPGTGATPVFMVHPIGGGTMQYMPIAQSLPGRHPIYGLQAKGFDGPEVPNDRVDAMADCYVEAIADVQPRGPYLLVGMCFGGLVAMEIARRLSARGEQIGVLAFLDTYPHPRFWPLRFKISYRIVRRIREAAVKATTLRRTELAAYIAGLLRSAVRKFAKLASGSGTQSFWDIPESVPPRIRAVFESGVVALGTYRPRPYPGKVSYLTCGYHAYEAKGPTAVWTRLIGQLDVQTVPYELLMTPAHPGYVANWLFDRIQDAMPQTAKSAVAAPAPDRDADRPMPYSVAAK